MIRIKDKEPKECAGKYLINKSNLGLQVITANQKSKSKQDFINDFLDEVRNHLNDVLEDVQR